MSFFEPDERHYRSSRGRMRREKASPRAVGQARRQQEADPELRELLDHLGRLLAKEYVRALTGRTPDKAAPRSEEAQ